MGHVWTAPWQEPSGFSAIALEREAEEKPWDD
jgi:hypothetical protein